MKKMLFWAAALVCCTVMAEIAASYDFDGKTGNAKAAGKFRYVDGFRNKAIALSDGTVRIPYPANLTPEEGSKILQEAEDAAKRFIEYLKQKKNCI